jgi:hypothetical protein
MKTTQTKDKFQAEQKPIIAELFETIKYDGHTIWKVGVLKKFPTPLRQRFTRILKSDGSPKGSIYSEGKLVKSTKGVYGLSLLRGLADDLGLAYNGNVFGRGTEARNISAVLEGWLK